MSNYLMLICLSGRWTIDNYTENTLKLTISDLENSLLSSYLISSIWVHFIQTLQSKQVEKGPFQEMENIQYTSMIYSWTAFHPSEVAGSFV